MSSGYWSKLTLMRDMTIYPDHDQDLSGETANEPESGGGVHVSADVAANQSPTTPDSPNGAEAGNQS